MATSGNDWARWLPLVGVAISVAFGVNTYTNQIAVLDNSVNVANRKSGELEHRIDVLSEEETRHRSEIVAMRQKLNEIETQFCASDHVRNLMHANDQRTFAILWEKIEGGTFHTDNTYYPIICQERGSSGEHP